MRDEASRTTNTTAGPMTRSSGTGPPVRRTHCVAAGDAATHYELLEPLSPPFGTPIVLVHGGTQTGECYMRNLLGEPGWAFDFAKRGHRVFVLDWPGCGASSTVPIDTLDGLRVCDGIAAVCRDAAEPVVIVVHSMSGAYGWKLVELLGESCQKLVAIAPAPPGNIQAAAQVIARGPDFVEVAQPASPIRLSKSEPAKLPRHWAELKLIGVGDRFPPDQIDAFFEKLVPIPPLLLMERTNVDRSQLQVSDFQNFQGKPILVVVGTHDLDHPVEFDRATACWLQEMGAQACFISLEEENILGNGHMMMLESNSAQIAELIAAWIERDVA